MEREEGGGGRRRVEGWGSVHVLHQNLPPEGLKKGEWGKGQGKGEGERGFEGERRRVEGQGGKDGGQKDGHQNLPPEGLEEEKGGKGKGGKERED